jgi:hypothetical protein
MEEEKGRLHLFRYESVVDDWMDAGLSPINIYLNCPDDYDCIQRMNAFGVRCKLHDYMRDDAIMLR